LEEVADYTFAVGIAAFVTLITASVLTDWPRFYYAVMRDNPPDRDERIAKRVRMFLWMHVGGIVIIRIIARLAYDLYGADKYLNGLEYLNYLVLGNFFFLAGNLFSSGIGYVKKNHLSLVTFGLPGLINVLLNFALIPLWGARAAALTTLTCYAAFSVACWFVGRPHYRLTHAGWYAMATGGALVVGLFPVSYVGG
jgi:O-antigen/teichoic acid export membrane protein